MLEKIKFYQTGSNTVGNRLLNPAMRTIQSSADRPNGLISGFNRRLPTVLEPV